MSEWCECRAYVRVSVVPHAPPAGRLRSSSDALPRQGAPSPNTFAVITSNSQVMAAGNGALQPPLLAPNESAVA
jgi:hypothetical protein